MKEGSKLNQNADKEIQNQSENNHYKEENEALKTRILELEDKIAEYEKVIDRKELLTADHSIDEKFEDAYAMDDKPINEGLEFTILQVDAGSEYDGKTVEQGEIVSVSFECSNTSIEEIDLREFRLNLIEENGTTYKGHMYNEAGSRLTQGDNWLVEGGSREVYLGPKFKDEKVVIFNVPAIKKEYLLEVENHHQPIYIKLDLE